MENINRKHCLKVVCNQLFYIRKHLQYLLEQEEEIKSSAVNLLVYKDVHSKEGEISDDERHFDVVLKSGLPKKIIDDIVCRAVEALKSTE
jgi:hypothetical protein